MRTALLFLLLLSVGHPTFAQPSQPQPTATVTLDSGLIFERYFETLPQGNAGLIRLNGNDLLEAEATLFDQTVPMFTVPDVPGHFALIAADMDRSIRVYDMTLSATRTDGTAVVETVPVEVSSGGFIQQDVIIPEDRIELIDPQVEFMEFERLTMLTSRRTDLRLWDEAGFQLPIESELTSPFGAVRTFNDAFETRHTGWDFRGGTGDIMRSAGAGRVIFADPLPIRGNYVLVDHGHGIFSGYAHLSVTHIVPGQRVIAGQIIGLAGNTGRSSDPHLHFEMQVNGEWVDPVNFVNMWVP